MPCHMLQGDENLLQKNQTLVLPLECDFFCDQTTNNCKIYKSLQEVFEEDAKNVQCPFLDIFLKFKNGNSFF